jgi:beta-galactosidase
MVPGFWRPPTDNDYPAALPYWKNYGLEAMTSQLRSFSEGLSAEDSDSVQVEVHTFMAPPSLDWGYHVYTTYTISPSGSIAVKAKFKPTGSMPKHVPRIGFDVRVNKQLQEARWFGLGPGEAYPDKKDAQRVGIWAVNSIADLQTHYDVPQENGNRMETRWVTMTATSGVGLRASADTPFNWQASRYSSTTIENSKHPCDFIGHEEKTTLLRLDRQVAGVGTAACGPGPREDMLVHTKEKEFQFVLERIMI